MRPYNFSAGPAMLPESLLKEAQAELLNWHDLGISVMEMGHRQPMFQALMEDSESALRTLLNIPKNYHILFLGGAARTQFAMIPLNLLNDGDRAAYLVSGLWSSLAYQEAERLKSVYCLATGEPGGFKSLPHGSNADIKPNTTYLYYTPNETVNGLRIATPPNIPGVPLIADMTSCLLSEPINISDYGMIFAGAQKNIAPAGLTLVIIRDDLVNKQSDTPIPTMLTYQTFAQTHSKYATPPTFNIYMANKMFAWVKEQGGVAALYDINCKKAAMLYDYIDASTFYTCDVEINARSLMNVCFRIKDSALEDTFVASATDHHLFGLKGHRLAGGLRASIYNAMPLSGVQALIEFMEAFAEENS